MLYEQFSLTLDQTDYKKNLFKVFLYSGLRMLAVNKDALTDWVGPKSPQVMNYNILNFLFVLSCFSGHPFHNSQVYLPGNSFVVKPFLNNNVCLYTTFYRLCKQFYIKQLVWTGASPPSIYKRIRKKNQVNAASALGEFRRVLVFVSVVATVSPVRICIRVISSNRLTCPSEAPPRLLPDPVARGVYKNSESKALLGRVHLAEGRPNPAGLQTEWWKWPPQRAEWPVSRTEQRASVPTRRPWSLPARITRLFCRRVWAADACLRMTASPLRANPWATTSWGPTRPRQGALFGRDQR